MLKKMFLIVVIAGIAVYFTACDNSGSSVTYPFYLTEVSTSGDIGGLTFDYIELYNSTDEDIDLTGYYFGDKEDTDDAHEVSSTVSVNVWSAANSAWEGDTGTTETVGDAAVIPAGGYLIVLFTNDLEIDDAVSKTTLPASWIESDDDGDITHTVGADFAGSTYLTIPEGLKGSKAEGVYIYKADGTTKATEFFSYEVDEQEDGKVFLYDRSCWSQGEPSPGAVN